MEKKMYRLDQTIERTTRRNSIKHFLRDKFVLAKQFESENGRKDENESYFFAPTLHHASLKILGFKLASFLYAVQRWIKDEKITIIYF